MRLVNLGEEGIALGIEADPRQVQAIGLRQAQLVELRAADQHQLFGILFTGPGVGTGDCLFQGGEHLGTFQAQVRLATDDDVEAPRQGPAERVPGLATHDDRLAQGQCLEVLEVRRQVPGQLVVAADDAVVREGGDQRKGECLVHDGEHSRATK